MSKAQEISDALDRMDNLLNPEYRLLSVPGDSATAVASRADMALIRAALSSSSEQQAAQQDAERWRFFRDEPEIQACTEDLYGKLIRNADDLDHAVDTEMSEDAARASNGGKA